MRNGNKRNPKGNLRMLKYMQLVEVKHWFWNLQNKMPAIIGTYAAFASEYGTLDQMDYH